MTDLPGADGLASLMHVSAAVAVVGLAFLGFDHVNATPDRLKDAMDAAEAKADAALTRLERSADEIYAEATIGKVYVYLPVCNLCILARKRFKVRIWVHFPLFLFVHKYTPFIRFFRSQAYRWFALGVTLFATGTLFFNAFIEIDDRYFLFKASELVMLLSLGFSLLIIVSISVASTFQRQSTLLDACDVIEAKANEAFLKYSRNLIAEFTKYGRRDQGDDTGAVA